MKLRYKILSLFIGSAYMGFIVDGLVWWKEYMGWLAMGSLLYLLWSIEQARSNRK